MSLLAVPFHLVILTVSIFKFYRPTYIELRFYFLTILFLLLNKANEEEVKEIIEVKDEKGLFIKFTTFVRLIVN